MLIRAACRSELFDGFGPGDVVLGVESDEHEAGRRGFAGEPVHGFAGHHGEAGRGEDFFGHTLHAGEDVSTDYEQLFLGGVGMGGDDTAGGGFQQEGGWSGVGVAIFAGDFEAVGLAVVDEVGSGEWRDDAMGRSLGNGWHDDGVDQQRNEKNEIEDRGSRAI